MLDEGEVNRFSTTNEILTSGEIMQSDSMEQDNEIFASMKNYSLWMHEGMENESLFPSASTTELVNGTLNATLSSGGRDEDLAKIEIAVLAVIFVLTVLGNFIVLTGIYFRCQKMTRMYYFILHLSIADLITAFFNVLTQLFWELTYRFQGGNILCKFVKYAQILGPYSSSYVLVMTALDRLLAICYPLSNCSWTARRSKLMLGSAWTVAFLFCIPQPFIFSYQEPWPDSHPGIYDCWATFVGDWGAKAYVTWYCITVFIIPLMILIFAYSCICRAIWLNFSIKNAIRRHEGTGKRMSPDSDCDGTENSINDHDPEDNKAVSSQRFQRNSKNKHYDHKNEEDFVKGLKVSLHRQDTLIDRGKISTSIASSNVLSLCQSTSDAYPPQSHSSQNHLVNASEPHRQNNKGNERGLSLLNHNEEIDGTTRNGNEPPSTTDIISNGRLTSSITRSDKSKKDTKVETKIYKWYSPSKLQRGNQNGNGESPPEHLFRQDSEIRSNSSNSRKPSCKQLLLLPGKSSRKKSVSSTRKTANSLNYTQPRTHSVKGISRAKIKTVKLTVTVICCYIFCSSPFIAAQLWCAYDPDAIHRPFYSGATFTILTLLASLNSCVNPWIFLFFNPNLLQDFIRGFCRPRYPNRQNMGRGGSPISHIQRTSPGFGGKSFRSTNRSVRVNHPNIQPLNLNSAKTQSSVLNNRHGENINNTNNLKKEKFHNLNKGEQTETTIVGRNSDNCIIALTEDIENNENPSLVRETSFISTNKSNTEKGRESSALWQCD